MSRKEGRFVRWLFWCTVMCVSELFGGVEVYGEVLPEFDGLVIGERNTREVELGAATMSQFESLKAREIEDFLKREEVQTYFQKNFDVDGSYGELRNGVIVTDWESLAKAMSTSGLVLAGAYAVWRRRRKAELMKLRSGDAEAIEGLFDREFGVGENGEKGEKEVVGGAFKVFSAARPGGLGGLGKRERVAGSGGIVDGIVWDLETEEGETGS